MAARKSKPKRGRPVGGNSGETRAKLVDAARRLFAQRGYDGVGIAEIVGTAKVTAPVLYHHFENKADLYAAAMTQVYDIILERFAEGAAAAEQFPDKLYAMLLAAKELQEEDPTIGMFVSSMPAQLTEYPELHAIAPQMARVRDFFLQVARRSPDVDRRSAARVAHASWVVSSGVGRTLPTLTSAGEQRQYLQAVRQLIRGELFHSDGSKARRKRSIKR